MGLFFPYFFILTSLFFFIFMFHKNRNLLIIALIVIVNALGYGIIIPILYSYNQKFGLSDFENGLLFATFSLCQFIATPLIGRMSDKYGRRPLLITSIAGTATSFFMMAFAPNPLFLFLARALDGITAGNIPVAQAVISDTTDPKDRAKGFGIIGASFSFGMIVGPAISALTVSYWDALPFIIAGTVTVVAVILTTLFLPETNTHMSQAHKGKLFDLAKLWHALFDEQVGKTLLISLVYSLAFSMFIYAFQPFTAKNLTLNTNEVSLFFTLFGVVGLIGQMILVPQLTKRFETKKLFTASLFTVMLAFAGMFFSESLWPFVTASILLGLANAIVFPLISTILSRETDEKSQGSIMGLNFSYMSIGQILGPIAGGAIATIAIPYPFLSGSIATLGCVWLSLQVLKPGHKKEALI